MKQAELVKQVAAEVGVSQKTVDAVLKSLTANISALVSKGDSVTLAGFGSFRRTHRAARVGKNPRTGKPLEISERFAPAFRASGEFRVKTAKAAETEKSV